MTHEEGFSQTQIKLVVSIEASLILSNLNQIPSRYLKQQTRRYCNLLKPDCWLPPNIVRGAILCIHRDDRFLFPGNSSISFQSSLPDLVESFNTRHVVWFGNRVSPCIYGHVQARGISRYQQVVSYLDVGAKEFPCKRCLVGGTMQIQIMK